LLQASERTFSLLAFQLVWNSVEKTAKKKRKIRWEKKKKKEKKKEKKIRTRNRTHDHRLKSWFIFTKYSSVLW